MNSRRDFLKIMAAMTAALSVPVSVSAKNKNEDRLGKLLPLRKLGRTNEYVTMLGAGGFHVGWTTERDAQEVIEAALEGGVRFFDTAESYSNGTSEERYGKFLTPKYRDLIFLMSKTTGKDAAKVREHLEGTLRRLKTDHLDLYQVHAIQTPSDVDSRIEAGVLEVLLKAKEEGKIRHIGFTGHQNPYAHLRMLERTKESDIFDTVLMPVNVLDQSYFSFTHNVIPPALERNMGILAIKSLADGRFFAKKERANWVTDDPIIPNYMSIKEAMYFVWSLPVTVLISGNENATFMREKIELARNFEKFTEAEKIALIEKVKMKAADGKIEYFKKKEA
ncbi:MAG: aldo/keto reductase [Bacteroidetes bacterium GWF2_42_66]|nr:MAG: aldo/keto reductase [Bacteroidetes bacterium GWA2_42_15]OFY02131.1 MAG: aldo/keto reductase [Bacteroidetes bacterium GWE2_42_39]OFY43477.1 MAG: aldo/keto reductase [Bacteroidetes bacterium GWF2_42_66]HBL76564.1 aldo/keto reductase [Prolixibacteraceae bacterium]HCR91099.1 aldo/keto reductase [Prolixibacteraceae bacterium]